MRCACVRARLRLPCPCSSRVLAGADRQPSGGELVVGASRLCGRQPDARTLTGCKLAWLDLGVTVVVQRRGDRQRRGPLRGLQAEPRLPVCRCQNPAAARLPVHAPCVRARADLCRANRACVRVRACGRAQCACERARCVRERARCVCERARCACERVRCACKPGAARGRGRELI